VSAIFKAPSDSYPRLTRFEAELLWHDRNDGPVLLWEWWHREQIPDDEFARLLPEVWHMAEFPVSSIGHKAWLDMFFSAGFVTDCGASRPEKPLTVYRGHDRAHMRGFSWTTRIEQAQWFAERFQAIRPPTFVFEVTVPPHAVLADILGRNEFEIVVNPNCLRGVATPKIARSLSPGT